MWVSYVWDYRIGWGVGTYSPPTILLTLSNHPARKDIYHQVLSTTMKDTMQEGPSQKRSSRYQFVAEHRGGPLTKAQHRLLIEWACKCVEHVLPLLEHIDDRLPHALEVAREWARDNVSVGDARKAATAAHDVAREATDPTIIAMARGVGHAVATAHMADHAPGAAEYALKALASEGKGIEEERRWQDGILPADVRELVLSWRERNRGFWETQRRNVSKSP